MRGVSTYGERRIDYRVVSNALLRSKLRIHVHPSGAVEVEAPVATTAHEVSTAVGKRGRWILRQLADLANLREQALPREYVSGETHFYLGRRYQLKVLSDRTFTPSVALRAGQLRIHARRADPATIRRLLDAWLKDRADEYFSKRIRALVQQISWIHKQPPLRLVKARKQWGSCTPSGAIKLNPALIRAPRECIDYVILHELCHLREHNHSKRYYALLSRHCPRWKATKSKLDSMAELLLAA